MKVVLDINVWISGFLWSGVPSQILRLAQNQQITVFISETLLQELEEALGRAKFQMRIQQRGKPVDVLMSVAKQLSNLCDVTPVEVPELRDPDDAIVLATALAANAEAIVTGDRDLLVLNEFSGIPIVTPQDFLSRYFPSP